MNYILLLYYRYGSNDILILYVVLLATLKCSNIMKFNNNKNIVVLINN